MRELARDAGYYKKKENHDSNVNAAPASANIFLPGFGLLPLAETSQKMSANFASLGAGGYLSYPIQPRDNGVTGAVGFKR